MRISRVSLPPGAAAALVAAALTATHPPLIAHAEPESALVSELLRRTEQNKDANAAQVKRITEQNAYTAVSGDIKRLVSGCAPRSYSHAV